MTTHTHTHKFLIILYIYIFNTTTAAVQFSDLNVVYDIVPRVAEIHERLHGVSVVRPGPRYDLAFDGAHGVHGVGRHFCDGVALEVYHLRHGVVGVGLPNRVHFFQVGVIVEVAWRRDRISCQVEEKDRLHTRHLVHLRDGVEVAGEEDGEFGHGVALLGDPVRREGGATTERTFF